jgi:hypothetical protein
VLRKRLGVLEEGFLGPFEHWKGRKDEMKCTFTLAVIKFAAS